MANGITGPLVLDAGQYCAAVVSVDGSIHSADDTASIKVTTSSCPNTDTYVDGFTFVFSAPTDMTAYADGTFMFNLRGSDVLVALIDTNGAQTTINAKNVGYVDSPDSFRPVIAPLRTFHAGANMSELIHITIKPETTSWLDDIRWMP